MKTKVTWKERGANGRTLKIDDTTYSHFPTDGDIIEIRNERFRVAYLESATVVLEVVPKSDAPIDEPVTLVQRNERVAKRLAEEKATAKPAVHKSVSKPLSITDRGNKVVSHKKK